MDIPIKIQLYLLFFIIILILCIGIYLFVKPDNSVFMKTFIIWYTIILEINLIHLYFILDFYEKHKLKKGVKGPPGDIGMRGHKGIVENCESCSPVLNTTFAGVTNDLEVNVSSRDKVLRGKCKFPFVHNHKHQYNCITSEQPPDNEVTEEGDYSTKGWCATKVGKKNEVLKYGYCKDNDQIKSDLSKEKQILNNREKYLNNNYGIIDIDIVSGNTEESAKKKCDSKGTHYNIVTNNDDSIQDLNEGVNGKFIYMCYKDGYSNLGINSLEVSVNADMDLNMKKVSDIDLNLNSNPALTPLYLYKKIKNENFIKDLKILRGNDVNDPSANLETICSDKLGDNFYNIHDNLNEGSSDNKLVLCGSSPLGNVDKIDMAFIYTNGRLYIFSGNTFFKMSQNPIQESIKSETGYPKNITEKWFNNSGCNRYNNEKTKCNEQDKCVYYSDSKLCEQIKFKAAFTYKYNNKVYFFQGSNVYLYDTKHMRVADDYPKKIDAVFKGIPENIDAVFTWGKDGVTYFFKDNLYWKYNDSKQQVEEGYPRDTSNRWVDFPDRIDAIFTLNVSLDKDDNFPTYIISGPKTYYIDPETEHVGIEKDLEGRFKGLVNASILPKIDIDN